MVIVHRALEIVCIPVSHGDGDAQQREKQEDLWIAHAEFGIGSGASVLSAFE